MYMHNIYIIKVHNVHSTLGSLPYVALYRKFSLVSDISTMSMYCIYIFISVQFLHYNDLSSFNTVTGGNVICTTGDNVSCTTGGNDTCTTGGNDTCTTGGNDTCTTGGNDTCTTGGNDTCTTGGNDTCTTGGNDTCTTGGNDTCTTGGNDTCTTGGNDTCTTGGNDTCTTGGNDTCTTGGNDTCTTGHGGNDTCTTGGNGTNSYRSILVGHPGSKTDITITATIGENVKLICSRIRAWKRWTSDMNELNKNCSHNMRIRGGKGYYNLTINSFQSSNAGMYTCGVTLRKTENETRTCRMLISENASICNYTVGRYVLYNCFM